MVERGARLNQIASFMDIPMWARKLKPAVAHWFCYVPDDLHCYLPEKTWEQRLWLRAFMSRGADNPDFAYWIARNVLKIGNRISPVLHFLSDMNDWVMEAKRKKPRCKELNVYIKMVVFFLLLWNRRFVMNFSFGLMIL